MKRTSATFTRGALTAILALFVALPQTPAAAAAPGLASLCEQAAQVAASESGVPVDVLRSITLTETGRRADGAFLPWPWTVNMEGIGKWFDTRAEAQDYVDRHFGRGARSFDVGCFQINYRWHGSAFSSIEEMFDPQANARYAARFLGELHAEFGDWSRAAGAYHSRTPALAGKYAERFERIRARLAPPLPDSGGDGITAIAVALPPLPETPPRVNRYPLLREGSTPGTLASLVPDGRSDGLGRFLALEGVRPLGVLR